MACLPQLQLASKSPRRRELLQQAGLQFVLCEPGEEYREGFDEHGSEPGAPLSLARQRARRKAEGAVDGGSGAPILAVDTVVDLRGAELGKAVDRAAAEALLRRLSGASHSVHTAHCVLLPARRETLVEEVCTSVVWCEEVAEPDLARYLDSDQWRGKAGAYGIQDAAQDFLHLESGAFDNVVGLHVEAVKRLLQAVRGRM